MSETLLSLFAREVARSPRRTALRARSGGIWRGRTWAEWRDTSHAIAAGLCALGIEPGDRVAILSHTRIQWVEADVGILHAGAAMVPLYPTLQPDVVGAILRDSGARAIFVEDPVQLEKVRAAGPLPALAHAIAFDAVSRLERPDDAGRLDVGLDTGADADAGEGAFSVRSLEALIEEGRARQRAMPEEIARRAESVEPDAMAAIYYTSGTSGEPKGVVLTHDNFVFETQALEDSVSISSSDEQLLFLPLAHIMAKLSVMLQLRVGYVTSFAESIDRAADDAREVRPTFLVGVPRVYEKIAEAILAVPRTRGDIQQRVFDWALGVGRRVSALRQERVEPGTLLGVQHRSAERLVYSRVAEGLGGRIRFLLSGAAPLAKETAELFHALDLLVLEGYGLTESCGASALNVPDRFRFGTVGPPLPGVSVRIADDGEILLKSRSLMRGYWQRGDEGFVDDGWFATGDVGRLDEDGFLMITDRKKDLIITAGGKNIAPARIEQRLERSTYIDRAVVLGDRRKFAVALLSLDHAALRAWAEERRLGGDRSTLIHRPEVRALVSAEVQAVNAGLAPFESIKRFEIVDEGFDRALTPTGKVRRAAVAAQYADRVDSLYEGVTTELEDLS